jgi:hypothetical protein
MGFTQERIRRNKAMSEKQLTKDEIAQIWRLVKREGKKPKEMMQSGLAARHPESSQQEESSSVKLAKLKLKNGEPLSPQDRMILGFTDLHGKGEDTNES